MLPMYDIARQNLKSTSNDQVKAQSEKQFWLY